MKNGWICAVVIGGMTVCFGIVGGLIALIIGGIYFYIQDRKDQKKEDAR